MLLDKEKLNSLNNDFLHDQKDMLEEQYEYYILQMLNAKIDNITENYFNAKTITGIIEGLINLDKQLTKEKEEGEKENVKA